MNTARRSCQLRVAVARGDLALAQLRLLLRCFATNIARAVPAKPMSSRGRRGRVELGLEISPTVLVCAGVTAGVAVTAGVGAGVDAAAVADAVGVADALAAAVMTALVMLVEQMIRAPPPLVEPLHW